MSQSVISIKASESSDLELDASASSQHGFETAIPRDVDIVADNGC